MLSPSALEVHARREPLKKHASSWKGSRPRILAVFAAQKKSRGAYGKKHLVDATNYKELSVQNYAALTADRLQREKELRMETARRRQRQRQRAKKQKKGGGNCKDKKLEERKSKKKNYVNYLRGHFTKVTVNRFESPRTKVQRTIDSITKSNAAWHEKGNDSQNKRSKGKQRSKATAERSSKVDRNSNQLALKRKTQISHREVRHNSKTLLQHLREQMKSSEGDYGHAAPFDTCSELRSSRLGALDLNVGLDQTKTNKHRERGKGTKENVLIKKLM